MTTTKTGDAESQFTADDLQDWRKYERVRKGGKWNMFDPRARRATKLSAERYSFVMRNFAALRDAQPITTTPKIKSMTLGICLAFAALTAQAIPVTYNWHSTGGDQSSGKWIVGGVNQGTPDTLYFSYAGFSLQDWASTPDFTLSESQDWILPTGRFMTYSAGDLVFTDFDCNPLSGLVSWEGHQSGGIIQMPVFSGSGFFLREGAQLPVTVPEAGAGTLLLLGLGAIPLLAMRTKP